MTGRWRGAGGVFIAAGLVGCIAGALAVQAAGDPISAGRAFASPNGAVVCRFVMRAGVPFADVAYAGHPVFEQQLGFARGTIQRVSFQERQVAHTWKPVWGFRAEYPDCYRELEVQLAYDGGRSQTLLMRCYDEGFAVRATYPTSAYGTSLAAPEGTRWRFVAGTKGWPIAGTEATYPEDPIPLEDLSNREKWRQPLTLVTPQNVWASILEADAAAQPRYCLRADKGTLRPESFCGPMEVRTLAATPWRIVMLSPSAARLVETAYLAENLNPPCALRDTAWITPGLTVSDMRNCNLRTDEILAAARHAKSVGAKYFQLDWGWYGTEYPWSDGDRACFRKQHPDWAADPHWEENSRANPFTTAKGLVPYAPSGNARPRRDVDLDIPLLTRQLKAMGLGLCLYLHGHLIENTDLEELFAVYESWGVAGLKPGFVAFGSQRDSEMLVRLAQTAARHHLWLDIHDAPIPDGFQRTWPNVMLTEGVGGEEGTHPVYHNVVLPFTRALAGPMDFTPQLYLNHRNQAGASKAHKLALFLAYPGPTAVMRGRLEEVVRDTPEAAAWLAKLPWNYDETRVLVADPGRRFVVARRKGDSWFVAGLAGTRGWAFEGMLDFLKAGHNYAMELLEDAPQVAKDAVRGYVCRRERVCKGKTVRIPLANEGGFIMTITEEKR